MTYWVAGNTKTSYYELNSIYGHDTFMLDVNNVGTAVKVHTQPHKQNQSHAFYVYTFRVTWNPHPLYSMRRNIFTISVQFHMQCEEINYFYNHSVQFHMQQKKKILY